MAVMNRKGKAHKTVSFFHKSLIITLLVSCLPMALLAVLTYSVGVRAIEREVSRTQKLQYKQVSERIDAQLAHLKFTVNQWAYNPLLAELKTRRVSADVRFTLDLYSQLLVMKSSNPLIRQVSLVLDQDGTTTMIDGDNGSRALRDKPEADVYRALLRLTPFISWADSLPHTGHDRHALSASLVQRVPIAAEPSFGVLVVDLSMDEIVALLQQLNPDGQGTAFVLNRSGGYLASSGAAAAENIVGALDETIRAEVLRQPEDSGSFLYTAGRETYVVSFGKLSSTGWLYASATPLSHLTKPVALISRLPLVASLFGLLIAVLLSWFASKQLYRPLQHLMGVFGSDAGSLTGGERSEVAFIESRWNYLNRERKDLQSKMEKALPTLRDSFLLQLVQGHLASLPADRLHAELEQFGIELRGRRLAMLVIQLYGFASSYSNPASGDERLLTFAAANIVGEMAAELNAPAYVINFHDLTVGVLFVSPEGCAKERIKSELFEFADAVAVPLRHYLKLKVVVGISRVTDSLKGVPVLLDDTRQAIRYYDSEHDHAVVDCEDAVPRGDHSPHYPFLTEKQLVQSLQLGLEEQSMQLAEQFMEALQETTNQEFVIQQGMLQLLGNVQYAMIQIGCSPQHIYRGANLFEQLLHIREPAAMLAWFQTKVIAPFIEEMQSIKDLHTKQMVDKVIRLLNDNYMTDISLEACADRFGTYPQKLSASFRQTVGVNFIDYLTNLRLEKSKELLLGTDLKITDIAEQVGYQPTYYNRIFKKREMMTPGQYRDKHTSATNFEGGQQE